MTPLESFLAEVRTAEAKATKGPWSADINGSPVMINSETDLWDCGEYGMKPSWIANAGSHYSETEKARVEANAEFIAKSRTYVPAMARVIEVSAALRDMLEDVAYSKSQYAARAMAVITTCDRAIAAALAGSEGAGE